MLMYATSKGRRIVKQEYREFSNVEYMKMAGLDQGQMEQQIAEGISGDGTDDKKSTKSTKSNKKVKKNKEKKGSAKEIEEQLTAGPNTRSTKSAEIKGKIPNTMTSRSDHAGDVEVDSRKSDFDDEDVLSMGSDASKVEKLNKEIVQLEPTQMELYNQYKCDQGLQCCLEDSELPDNLLDTNKYTETLEMHKQQLLATTDREQHTTRRSEIIQLREEIIQKRERAKFHEMETDLMLRRAAIEPCQAAIDQRK